LPALDAAPWFEIEDLYLSAGRLRLRRVTAADGRTQFKLCKKYGKLDGVREWITNLYLSEAEYAQLSPLAGQRVLKRRHSVAGGALDLYAEPRLKFAVFEREFPDELSASRYEPPEFAGDEVTNDPSFSGAALAHRTQAASSQDGAIREP
jgi:CYTH domain-containing protein